MSQFIDPFLTVVPRKLTRRELSRCIRQALASEQEAVHLYEAVADATDDPLARAVLQDIANEERVHAGEFQRLLNLLLEDEADLLAEGADEVNELAEELKNGAPEAAGEKSAAIPVPGDCK